MRYITPPTSTYVPQYTGNPYPTELLLAAGQKLEKDKDAADETLAKTQFDIPYGPSTQEAQQISTEYNNQKDAIRNELMSNKIDSRTATYKILNLATQFKNDDRVKFAAQDDMNRPIAAKALMEAQQVPESLNDFYDQKTKGFNQVSFTDPNSPNYYKNKDANSLYSNITPEDPWKEYAPIINAISADVKDITMGSDEFMDKEGYIVNRTTHSRRKVLDDEKITRIFNFLGEKELGMNSNKFPIYEKELARREGRQYTADDLRTTLINLAKVKHVNEEMDKYTTDIQTGRQVKAVPVDPGALPTPLTVTASVDYAEMQPTDKTGEEHKITSYDQIEQVLESRNPITATQTVLNTEIGTTVPEDVTEHLIENNFDPAVVYETFNSIEGFTEEKAEIVADKLKRTYEVNFAEYNDFEQLKMDLTQRSINEAKAKGLFNKASDGTTLQIDAHGEIIPDKLAIQKANNAIGILSLESDALNPRYHATQTPTQLLARKLKANAGLNTPYKGSGLDKPMVETPEIKLYNEYTAGLDAIKNGGLTAKAQAEEEKALMESTLSVYNEQVMSKNVTKYNEALKSSGNYGKYKTILEEKTKEAFKVQNVYTTYLTSTFGAPQGTKEGDGSGEQMEGVVMSSPENFTWYDMSGEAVDKAVVNKELQEKIQTKKLGLAKTTDGIVKDIYNGRWYVKFNGLLEGTQDDEKAKVGDPSKIYMADITDMMPLQVSAGKIDGSILEEAKYSHAIYKEVHRLPIGNTKHLTDLKVYGIAGGEDIRIKREDKTHYSLQGNVGTSKEPVWQTIVDENGKKTFEENGMFTKAYKLLLTAGGNGGPAVGKSQASLQQLLE